CQGAGGHCESVAPVETRLGRMATLKQMSSPLTSMVVSGGVGGPAASLALLPHGQSFAFLYPAWCASASVANDTIDAGFIPAYPLQPGIRYTLLLRFPW